MQLIVPGTMKKDIIQQKHDTVVWGHLGAKKTEENLRKDITGLK
jgi:hypothetical protein